MTALGDIVIFVDAEGKQRPAIVTRKFSQVEVNLQVFLDVTEVEQLGEESPIVPYVLFVKNVFHQAIAEEHTEHFFNRG